MLHPAVGNIQEIPKKWRRLFQSDGHAPIPTNNPSSDWLGSNYEREESFDDFKRKSMVASTAISIQSCGVSIAEVIVPYVAAWFQLPVMLTNRRAMPKASSRLHPIEGVEQFFAVDMLTSSATQEHIDGSSCKLVLTNKDIYPGEQYSYVFGLAWPARRVAVASTYRFDNTKLLHRTAKVSVHELGHVFGLAHCKYFRCTMNGSNHIDEADARPLKLCPVCLRKLTWVTGFDPLAREKNLSKITKELNL